MKALFLGAGASYEVGMPLVWEFTNVLRRVVLKRIDTNLFNFKNDLELKNEFISLFENHDLHYEQIVAHLENLYLRARGDTYKRNVVHGIIIQLTETIQLLLLEDQSLIKELLTHRVKDYYGLKEYLSRREPTFVYSLNHDVVFEEICTHLSLPLSDGFYDDSRGFGNIAPFSSISSKQLESGELNFFKNDTFGLNLVKLHGSLDIFAIEDMDYFIKAKALGQYVGGHIDSIVSIEKSNALICQRDQYRVTNELTVEDDNGKIQFLRRSLLSGGNKFKNEMSQIAPATLLDYFKQSLNQISELTVIGYSFGDGHINDILGAWASKPEKLVRVFDPYMTEIPECLGEHEVEVQIVNGGFTDFCLMCDSSEEPYQNKSMRDVLDTVRLGLKHRREKQT
ncbi:hypothetical protein MHM95_10815 [Pseudoalteromonas sp. CnMc7-15]|uniref:hypothetical protein n=1 Tax=unclassified Pseudoalteromonas TaxID=194690 RepID=UPI001EF7362B|nr:hypothetical protein [Pseudoalteromonas sp. CnMc7-15]MCG7566774.1 hypothetical protein [Pseudoalteromonas sp. CnMc7-15]